MRKIEHLQKLWRDSARFRGLHASMTLERDALVLGANTVLAKRDHEGALAIGGEEKLLTLLSVAHGRPIGASVLKRLRRASDFAKAGNSCLASMHVALALPALRNPANASRRLFIAEGLLERAHTLVTSGRHSNSIRRRSMRWRKNTIRTSRACPPAAADRADDGRAAMQKFRLKAHCRAWWHEHRRARLRQRQIRPRQ